MKSLFFIVMSVLLVGATEKKELAVGLYDISYITPKVNILTAEQLVGKSGDNPYSRALGPRIAGWVLLGTSVLNFIIAVPYGRLIDDLNSSSSSSSVGPDGDFYTGLIFAEGGIRACIGAALLGVGYSKYGRWKRWENEHGAVSSGGYRLGFNFEY